MIEQIQSDAVQGWLHVPAGGFETAIVLSHGAGSNANSRLLIAVSDEFAARGVAALRIDLPFRRTRRTGPPHPSTAARDRDGIAAALQLVRERGAKRIFAGGHSYGGRQTSILASEQTHVADALMLLSYPLHPPRKPEQLRVAHFPALSQRCLFVHGTRDPFGTPEEIRAHLPVNAKLILIDGAAHELKPVIAHPQTVVAGFLDYSLSEAGCTPINSPS